MLQEARHIRTPSISELREDFRFDPLGGLGCPTLDAPEMIPNGATVNFDCGEYFGMQGHVFRDGELGYRSARMKKTDEIKPLPKPRGGARKGSGRPKLDADGSMVTTVRMTPKQKATFDMLGGVQWLRHQLDLFAEGECSP